jgi:TolA-binding protein
MQFDRGDFITAVSLFAEAIKYDPEAATAPEAQYWCGVASLMRVGLI